VGVVLAAGTVAFAGWATTAGADDPAPLAGIVTGVDPAAEMDWLEPIADPFVAQAAADGATVTEQRCVIGDVPTIDERRTFARPIRTTGHLVVTPSGNVHFVCHAQARTSNFFRVPTEALVFDGLPCALPEGRGTTRDSHLVVTPSLQVHVVCHL